MQNCRPFCSTLTVVVVRAGLASLVVATVKTLNLVVVGVITAVSVVADVAVVVVDDVAVGVVVDFVGASVFIGVVVVVFKEDIDTGLFLPFVILVLQICKTIKTM